MPISDGDGAAKNAAIRAAFTDQNIETFSNAAFSYLQGWYHHDAEPAVPFDVLRDAIKYALKEWPQSN